MPSDPEGTGPWHGCCPSGVADVDPAEPKPRTSPPDERGTPSRRSPRTRRANDSYDPSASLLFPAEHLRHHRPRCGRNHSRGDADPLPSGRASMLDPVCFRLQGSGRATILEPESRRGIAPRIHGPPLPDAHSPVDPHGVTGIPKISAKHPSRHAPSPPPLSKDR
jgi:hypothetical protein